MHTRPDGVAVADHRPSIAPAACIDSFHDLEIGQCGTRLRLLVAAGFAVTLFSASLAFGWWGEIAAYDTTIGYLGVALFGPVTAWLIWMLPAERGPVVIVTPFGIRDLRIGNEFLLWESVADVSVEDRSGRKVIVLTPTPALQQQLSSIRAVARSARGERQDERIVIRPDGLATDFDTLLRACRDCHAAANPAAASNQAIALQQEDEHGTHGIALQAS